MKRATAGLLLFGAASCATPAPVPCGCLPPEEEPASVGAALVQAPRLQAARLSPEFLLASARPDEDSLKHETRASALFDGAAFHARGRTLDERVAVHRISTGDLPASFARLEDSVRHMKSGLDCPQTLFTPDSGGAMTLAAVVEFDDKGLDVGCDYSNGAASATLYASYYPAMTLGEHGASAAAAIRQRFNVRGALPVIVVELLDEDKQLLGDEPAIAGAFDIGEINGAPYKTALWLAKTGGWHVKARATYPAGDAQFELSTALIFSISVAVIDIHLEKAADSAGV